MNMQSPATVWKWMAAIVGTHLVIAAIHGTAHTNARVPMSQAANLFVFVVILAGPMIGLVISMWAKLWGAVVIALTMAASLIFGVVNHFIIDSPDLISHIAAPWSRLFAITAVLLAITELLGMVVALRLVRALRPALTD